MDVRPGYKPTDVGVIPEGWEIRAVSEKGRVTTGKALAVDAPGKPRRYLRTKNVMDGHIVLDDVLCMPMTDEQFALFEVRSGDVLLNEGQSLELVGRCAMYRGELGEPCAIQNQLIRFRAYDEVSPHFATHLFRHCQQSGVFAKIALQTTSIAHLGGVRFARLNLAWPETQIEQDAIAEVLSDADSLASALSHLIAKKRGLKQAAMQQLLTGQTRLPGFHGEWEVKRLGDIVDTDPEQLGPDTAPSFAFNYIALEGVNEGVLTGFSEQRFDRSPSRARRRLRKGDILVSTVRPNLRSHLLFDVGDGPWVCSTGFCVLRCIQGVSHSAFMFQHFFGSVVNRQIDALLTGSSYPAISNSDVRSLRIPCPSFPEQVAIAAVLSDMDAEISALEARRDKTLALKQAMMQELLTGRTRLV